MLLAIPSPFDQRSTRSGAEVGQRKTRPVRGANLEHVGGVSQVHVAIETLVVAIHTFGMSDAAIGTPPALRLPGADVAVDLRSHGED